MKQESMLDRFVQTRGHRVSEGTDEFGLLLQDALKAISLAREEDRTISGGDVYVRLDDGIEPAYANWHVDSLPDEPLADYRLRCWEESMQYVSRYPISSGGKPLFVLVFFEG